MKRLLVLMLCAVLAVPAVGMNVSATEQNQEQQLDTNDTGDNTLNGMTALASNDPITERSFGELAKEATNKLSDYYLLLEVTSEQKAESFVFNNVYDNPEEVDTGDATRVLPTLTVMLLAAGYILVTFARARRR